MIDRTRPLEPTPLLDFGPIVEIAVKLQDQVESEGSAAVRHEIISAIEAAFYVLGKWTTFAILIRSLDWAMRQCPRVSEL